MWSSWLSWLTYPRVTWLVGHYLHSFWRDWWTIVGSIGTWGLFLRGRLCRKRGYLLGRQRFDSLNGCDRFVTQLYGNLGSSGWSLLRTFYYFEVDLSNFNLKAIKQHLRSLEIDSLGYCPRYSIVLSHQQRFCAQYPSSFVITEGSKGRLIQQASDPRDLGEWWRSLWWLPSRMFLECSGD